VQFKLADAQRIANVVGTVEGARRDRKNSFLSRAVGQSSHYLSKTTATWTIGTSQTLTLYVGDPGSEAASSGDTVDAWNKTGGDIASGKWVLLARANGNFYLAEPEVVEQEVLTGVTLGPSGLVFTKETVYVIGKKSPSPSDITISPVDASVITHVSLGAGGLTFTKRGIKVLATSTASEVTIGTTTCP